MKKTFLYKGAGAAIKVGLGFIPQTVTIRNLTSAGADTIVWDDAMGAVKAIGGGVLQSSSDSKLAFGAGVQAYAGGDAVENATQSAACFVLAQEVEGYRGDLKGAITGWTLDTAASRTGHFDAGVDTAKVGVGSVVTFIGDNGEAIDARVIAITNDGDAANEVTLDKAIPTGRVGSVLCCWDLVPAPIGFVMPQGIEIKETSKVNKSNDTVAIVAGR